MKKLSLLLCLLFIELLRLVLFIWVIVFAAGGGMIIYKLYEAWFDLYYTIECTLYLFGIVIYFILVFIIDKILMKELLALRGKIKNNHCNL